MRTRTARIAVVACAGALLAGVLSFLTVAVGQSSATASLPPPAGYSAARLIFDDNFAHDHSALNTRYWNTYMGDAGNVWSNDGEFPLPYSGPNSPKNGGTGSDAEMYSPSQVSVSDSALKLKAEPNTSGPTKGYANPRNGFATWLSGVVTTEGKITLPSTGWYVQASIKTPDLTQGMWPAMWFVPGRSRSPFNEIDSVQGGFTPCRGQTEDFCPLATGYFDRAGDLIGEKIPNVGFDASASYNTYGVQYIPGVSVTEYVNGTKVWQVTNSAIPGGIKTEGYEIILDLQVATRAGADWRTIPNRFTPESSMTIQEVQAYAY